jgi:hypothetical protein
MSDDQGLPLPPLPPRPTAPAIERGPDLEAGMVGRALSGIVSAQNPSIGRLALAATSQGSGRPTFQPFNPGGAGKPLSSTLEDAVDTSSPEVALAKFLGNTLARPFTSAVDQYQVGKIRDLLNDFYHQHNDDLKMLSHDLNHAKGTMGQLGDWMANQHIPTNDIRGILDKKAATGKRAMADLDYALASATDPDDRARLQAMKKDFDKWSNERDERLKPEAAEVNQLENRIDKLNREIFYGQSGALHNAGFSDGPSTETEPGSGKVVSSTHQQPQALDHVRSLRDFLLGERQRLIRIMQGSD